MQIVPLAEPRYCEGKARGRPPSSPLSSRTKSSKLHLRQRYTFPFPGADRRHTYNIYCPLSYLCQTKQVESCLYICRATPLPPWRKCGSLFTTTTPATPHIFFYSAANCVAFIGTGSAALPVLFGSAEAPRPPPHLRTSVCMSCSDKS